MRARVYLDTSAAAKLVVSEPETGALLGWLVDEDPELHASVLLRLELGRLVQALRESGAGPVVAERATAVQARVAEHALTDPVVVQAATLPPAPGRRLRALDAVHLATALHAGLRTVLTFDGQLAAAAEHHGLRVLAPGSG